MHILYVDESGDDGFSKTSTYDLSTTPTGFYIRTGIVIHDLKWHSIDKEIEKFRLFYKIPSDKELHATEILNGRHRIYKNKKPIYAKNWFGDNFNKKERKEILVSLCGLIAQMDLSIFYIIIDKAKISVRAAGYKEFPKLKSWEFLIERYNLFLTNQIDQKGIIISDAVTISLESKHREFAKAIYTTSLHVQNVHFIESILFEPSHSSNLLQLADVAAFACGRKNNSGDPLLFDIIKGKIFSYNGTSVGYGSKFWPE